MAALRLSITTRPGTPPNQVKALRCRRSQVSTFRQKARLPVATYFSSPKLKWLLDNVPELREKAQAGRAVFGNVDTWVIWNLTGGAKGGAHVTDVTNASRTMLMSLRTLDWDDELLELLSIPRQMLPQIRPSSDADFYGATRAEGPLGGAVPVCGDLGDQQAALFGQTCYDVGEAKNTYGTGCFMLLNTGPQPVPSQSGLLTTVAYGLPEGTTYALEGSIAITGAAVQWLRDNLGLIRSAAETESIAQGVEDAGGIYFVPAFSGLFAPYWDMDARGVIVGLTRYVTRAHVVRATLEAICYQTRDVLEAMQADASAELTALKVDGGATVNNFLMQLQADVLGVPVVRPTVHETTALGAAYAAGLATGLWAGPDELRANWGVERVFEPQWDEARREEGYAGCEESRGAQPGLGGRIAKPIARAGGEHIRGGDMPAIQAVVVSILRAALTWLSRRRLPQVDGALRLPGLNGLAEVIRDRWGVPHIYAENERDLFFAQGFVHAQDRLWQMDFNRRLVAGRLSEAMGATTLPVDRWIRILGLRRVAEQEVALVSAEVHAILKSYAAGVDACISQERLPIEFTLLRYRPEPWGVVDTLSWIKLMSWWLSVNWESELLRARLIDRQRILVLSHLPRAPRPRQGRGPAPGCGRQQPVIRACLYRNRTSTTDGLRGECYPLCTTSHLCLRGRFFAKSPNRRKGRSLYPPRS